MPKQHTFKTTRKTAWLDDYLDCIPDGYVDKSDFIREMLIAGINVTFNNVLPKYDVSNTEEQQTNDKRDTNEGPSDDENDTNLMKSMI